GGGVQGVGRLQEGGGGPLLDRDERPVGGQPPAVLHTDGRGRLGWTEPEPRGDAGSLVERLVVAIDGLLLVFGEARPVLGRLRRGGVALMDQQDVLHRFLLLGMVDSKTNGGRAKGQLDGNRSARRSEQVSRVSRLRR